jgi:hypothetical protein
MRRDPNTRVIHRPPGDDVLYKQRVNNMIISNYNH